MQKSEREKVALRQLRAEETELQLRLAQVRKAISALDDSHSELRQDRPKCRADLLRDYLLDHPSGVRLKDVPAVLKAMGHTSFAAHQTTNWVYQLKSEKAYFVIAGGIITLHPKFNGTIPSAPDVTLNAGPSVDKAAVGEKQATSAEQVFSPTLSENAMAPQAASNH
jgi:hypothetical protein